MNNACAQKTYDTNKTIELKKEYERQQTLNLEDNVRIFNICHNTSYTKEQIDEIYFISDCAGGISTRKAIKLFEEPPSK